MCSYLFRNEIVLCTWTRLQQYESEKQEHFVSTELNTGSSYFTGIFAFHEMPDNLQNLTFSSYSCLSKKRGVQTFFGVLFCPVSLREGKCSIFISIPISLTLLLFTSLIQRHLSMGDVCVILHSRTARHLSGTGDLCLGFVSLSYW